jgi:signal transduction histidine kinase
MLFLAKSDSDKTNHAVSNMNFSDLVQGTLLSFASVAFEADVHMTEEIHPDVQLCGSESQLRRLCAILIDNAVKYAGRGGKVHAILRSDGTTCRLSVRNTGAPISEDALPHLFERFYRADRSRSTGGFGLGLAIAESIVLTHGGRIRADSNATEGTTFHVTLPICADGKHRGGIKEC